MVLHGKNPPEVFTKKCSLARFWSLDAAKPYATNPLDNAWSLRGRLAFLIKVVLLIEEIPFPTTWDVQKPCK